MLTAKQLHIQIDSLVLANDVNFQLRAGEVTTILGPNGTGKSTLLKALFGDRAINSGSIHIGKESLDAMPLAQWRDQFGYMPQDINLDVNLTAIEVVLMGRLDALSLRVGNEMLASALQILDSMGLLHLANRDVRTLSGGQCQMVLFAQALMRDPKVMMLDEPVSALDLHFQHVMLEHLVTQTRQKQYVTLMVLHDLNLAAQYSDNLLVLKQGKLVRQGQPRDVLTSELVQSIYNVDAEVLTDKSGIPFVRALRAVSET